MKFFFRGRLFSPSEEELGERNSVVEIRDFFPGCLGGTVGPSWTDDEIESHTPFFCWLCSVQIQREREREKEI